MQHQKNPNSPRAFSAIVLAGGLSSRMGQDKALLRLGSDTMLSRTIALAYQMGAVDVVVSRNQPGFVQDIHQHQGPLAGLHAALPLCRCRRVLVLAVDMPRLSQRALTQLLAQPVGFFAGHPLPAVIDVTKNLQQEIFQRLQLPHGPRSLATLWRFAELPALPCHYPDELCNTNDPNSWQQVLKDMEIMHA